MLPSVAELTTGVSAYSTPAYTLGGGGGGPSAGGAVTSPVQTTNTAAGGSRTASPGAAPGPLLPALSPYPTLLEPPGPAAGVGLGKRRASPPDVGMGARETSRRRQFYPSSSRGVEQGRGGGGYHPLLPPPPPASSAGPPFGVGMEMGPAPVQARRETSRNGT
ncbi:hypothetical protein VTI74DRAFT_9448 [Chaetomium olivicolor]